MQEKKIVHTVVLSMWANDVWQQKSEISLYKEQQKVDNLNHFNFLVGHHIWVARG